MPIVVLVAGTLVFWVIYWFIRMGGVDHFREQSARRKEEARRAQAREMERTAPLRAIDDPRDAATVLMLLIPRGRDPTARQIAAIEEIMRVVFGFDHDVNERLTHARFIASRAQNFAQAAGSVGRLHWTNTNAQNLSLPVTHGLRHNPPVQLRSMSCA